MASIASVGPGCSRDAGKGLLAFNQPPLHPSSPAPAAAAAAAAAPAKAAAEKGAVLSYLPYVSSPLQSHPCLPLSNTLVPSPLASVSPLAAQRSSRLVIGCLRGGGCRREGWGTGDETMTAKEDERMRAEENRGGLEAGGARALGFSFGSEGGRIERRGIGPWGSALGVREGG